MERKNRKYLNNKDFNKSLLEFYEKCNENEGVGKPQPEIPKYIAECIMEISNNLSRKNIFYLYTYREDMVYDAIEKMIEAVRYKKFDPKLSKNPFAYFTQISWNAFLQRIEKEKKERYVLHKNMENIINMDEYSVKDYLDNEEHSKVIEDFEKPKDTTYPKHRNLSYTRHKPKEKKVINV